MWLYFEEFAGISIVVRLALLGNNTYARKGRLIHPSRMNRIQLEEIFWYNLGGSISIPSFRLCKKGADLRVSKDDHSIDVAIARIISNSNLF